METGLGIFVLRAASCSHESGGRFLYYNCSCTFVMVVSQDSLIKQILVS